MAPVDGGTSRLTPLTPREALRELSRRFGKRVSAWPSVRMFRSDRYLTLATLVLSVSALAPLLATPMLPLIDLGSNVGAAMLLDDAAFGSGVVAQHFHVQRGIIPYWTGYLLLAALEHVVGVLWAMKLVVGLCVVSFPIALMRVLYASGRSPYIGLGAFMLTWDTNLYWGWFTFQLGMSLSLWALAWVIEMRRWRDVAKLAVLAAVVAVTHVHAVAYALTTGGLLILLKRPLRDALKQGSVVLACCLGMLLPWLLRNSGSSSTTSRGFHAEQHPLGQKLASLYSFSLDNLPQQQTLTAFAFLLFLILPAVMSVLPQRQLTPLQRRAPIAILLAALLLYTLVPFAIHSPIVHWWTYPRFATYVLLGLLICPAPDWSRWRWVLLTPVAATAIALHVGVFQQSRAYRDYVSPYLDIIAAIEPNSRLLPLDLDDARFKGTRFPSVGQLHGYAAAMTSSYDGHLFDYPTHPLLYRRDRILPHPSWFKPAEFEMTKHGVYYDYIIVHPLDLDPIAKNPGARARVDLVREAGAWRLYRVKERQAYP